MTTDDHVINAELGTVNGGIENNSMTIRDQIGIAGPSRIILTVCLEKLLIWQENHLFRMNTKLPEIARFFGIIIRMFAEAGTPHHSPHFHVYYQNHVAVYLIDVVDLISGGLPRKQQRLVEAWAELHQGELMENWERLQSGQFPYKIAPLK